MEEIHRQGGRAGESEDEEVAADGVSLRHTAEPKSKALVPVTVPPQETRPNSLETLARDVDGGDAAAALDFPDRLSFRIRSGWVDCRRKANRLRNVKAVHSRSSHCPEEGMAPRSGTLMKK